MLLSSLHYEHCAESTLVKNAVLRVRQLQKPAIDCVFVFYSSRLLIKYQQVLCTTQHYWHIRKEEANEAISPVLAYIRAMSTLSVAPVL